MFLHRKRPKELAYTPLPNTAPSQHSKLRPQNRCRRTTNERTVQMRPHLSSRSQYMIRVELSGSGQTQGFWSASEIGPIAQSGGAPNTGLSRADGQPGKTKFTDRVVCLRAPMAPPLPLSCTYFRLWRRVCRFDARVSQSLPRDLIVADIRDCCRDFVIVAHFFSSRET